MPYTQQVWHDSPAVDTPTSAARFGYMEAGIAAAVALLIPTAIKTAAYTAAVGDLALMNVSGGATTLTLPTAPADKSQVAFRAIGATSGVPLVVTAGSGDTITLTGTTGSTTLSIPLADETVVLQYITSRLQWIGVSDVKTLASLTPAVLGAAATVHSHLTAWALEVLGYSLTRAISVGDVPEGLRVSSARTLTQVYHRFGTADASGTTTIQSYLNGTLISGSAVSIVAPALAGATGVLSIALAVGDVITHQITAVGTTPGARLSTQTVGTQLCT